MTISGVEFRPGNRRIVHHSRVHLDTTGDAIRRDRTDPGPGFAGWLRKVSFELPYPGLGGWSPGMTARPAPEGVGRLIPRGSDLAFMIHYHPSGKVERDQSSVGLYFSKSPVTRQMTGLTLSTAEIDIPPGARRHKLIQSARLKADVNLYTVVPHAALPLPRVSPGRDAPGRHLSAVALDPGLGYGLAGPVSIRQARAPSRGDHPDPGRLFRQLRR